jgi:hypothetical protein
MSPNSARFCAISFILLTGLAHASATELTDHGVQGESFYDAQTGLYWLDPAVLAVEGRESDDHLVQVSPIWDWATSAQVDALLGRTAPAGLALESIIGPRQFTLASGGPRWIGFHADAGPPNGWLIQSDDPPAFATVTESGFQGGAENWGAGAWLVSTSDPVDAPRLVDYGDNSEYFHDLGTGLYWCDPATFVGQTRDEVGGWILAHSLWRWATADEVYALLARMTDDGGPLTAVMGAAQFELATGGPRWIGYYEQASQPDGLLLQASYAPSFHIVTAGGTQGGVAAWNPGAWVVSETGPTAAEPTTWGSVKAGYR